MEEALSGLARFLLAATAAFFCDCCGCDGGGGCSLWSATTGWYRLVFAQEKGSTVLVILRQSCKKINSVISTDNIQLTHLILTDFGAVFGVFLTFSACGGLTSTDSGGGEVFFVVVVFLALLSDLDLVPFLSSSLLLFLAALFTVLTVLATHSS